MKSKHKKAQVSSVFKYIFALIAGAIILVFFIRFAFQAGQGGTELVKAEVLHMLDSSLQAFSVSTHSTGVLPTPPWPQIIDIRFGTKANCGKFTIEGQKYFVQINKIIFGPEEMKAKQLQAWTTSWNFPFRVTNFFYLTNDKSKYYLVPGLDNKEFVKSISSYEQEWAFKMERFPKEFKVEYTETEPSTKPTIDMTKVNHFKPVDKVPHGIVASYIKVSNECKDESLPSYRCFGEVYFYYDINKRDGSCISTPLACPHTGTSTFIGREMMFGAMMASSIEEYRCQYQKALDDLERMIGLYATKAEKLKIKKPGCSDKYQFMIELLNKMKQDIRTNSISLSMGGAAGETLAAELSNDAKNIDEYNENELGGYESCEIVF